MEQGGDGIGRKHFFQSYGDWSPVPSRAIRTLAWICRGLGNSCAVRALQELLKREDPNVFFLGERKLHAHEMHRIRRGCDMQSCF